MANAPPRAGTVVDVAAEGGESVSSGSIVTLADLENSQIRFWVEESDMSSVAVGNGVNVVFDALPEEAYLGEIESPRTLKNIMKIDPVLPAFECEDQAVITFSYDEPARQLNGLLGFLAFGDP